MLDKRRILTMRSGAAGGDDGQGRDSARRVMLRRVCVRECGRLHTRMLSLVITRCISDTIESMKYDK